MFNLWGAHKTFRPKKSYPKNRNDDLQDVAKATLGSGDLTNAVKVPKGEDSNEWLASNTVDFYNTVNLLYGSISEYCTKHSCPCMSAGDKYEYLWMNPPEIPKPVKCSAPEYIDYLMSWIEKKLNNENLFPVSPHTPFPSKFKKELKTIYKRLFRVFAHIYHSHFDQVQKYGEEAHLNTAFKHFLLFVWEFKLIKKEELVPLNSLIIELFGEPYRSKLLFE